MQKNKQTKPASPVAPRPTTAGWPPTQRQGWRSWSRRTRHPSYWRGCTRRWCRAASRRRAASWTDRRSSLLSEGRSMTQQQCYDYKKRSGQGGDIGRVEFIFVFFLFLFRYLSTKIDSQSKVTCLFAQFSFLKINLFHVHMFQTFAVLSSKNGPFVSGKTHKKRRQANSCCSYVK